MSIIAPHSPGIPDEFPAGTVFAGKYCVERVIGRGGMGAVLSARHMDLGHRVAIKVLHESLASDPRATERFQREARASVRLESDHVAHVSDVGTDHGTSYMTMEYLEGEDLASILKLRGRIPQQEAVSWILEACDAVAEAHSQGIIHRDLKPANLFLARRKRGAPQIKVLDFGISKTTIKSRDHRPQEELTETQAIVGTPHYASPEQLRGDQGLDARSDIWSLGILLHRLLSGGRPFEAETASGLIAAIAADPPTPIRSAAPEVSVEIEAIILRCLEKQPADRYQDVAALARALEPFAAPELREMVRHIEKLSLSIPPEPSTKRQTVSAAQSLRELLTSSGRNAEALKKPRPSTSLPLVLLVLLVGLTALGAIAAVVIQPQSQKDSEHRLRSARVALSPAAELAARQQEGAPRADATTSETAPPELPASSLSATAVEVDTRAAASPPVRKTPQPQTTQRTRAGSRGSSPRGTPPSVAAPVKAKPSSAIIESDPYAN